MKLLEELTHRYNISNKRLNAMTGISPRRLAELGSDMKPTKLELHQLETIKRYACICSHGLNFDMEIEYQKKQIEMIEKDLRKKLLKCDSETEEAILNCVEGLKAECVYLGCFYSDNNQEEEVHRMIRHSRKVKGSQEVR